MSTYVCVIEPVDKFLFTIISEHVAMITLLISVKEKCVDKYVKSYKATIELLRIIRM